MGDGFDEFAILRAEMETSVLDGGAMFCGTTQEAYAINGVTHGWKRGSKVKIGIDFDNLGVLTLAQVKEVIEACCKEVTDVTDGISYELFSSPLHANLVLKLARIDGGSGILGDCMIPPPGATTDNTQLVMRCDTGEKWGIFEGNVQGGIDFYRFFLHEFGHGNGQGHQPVSVRRPAIIQPMYGPLRNLQDADKEEYVRRYGGKTTPVVPPGGARIVKGTIEVEIDGVKWRADGPLKRVT